MAKRKPIKTWDEFVAATKRMSAKRAFINSRLEAFREDIVRRYSALREELNPTFCELDQLQDGCQAFMDDQFASKQDDNNYALAQAGRIWGGAYEYGDKFARLGHRISAGLWE